MLLGAHSQAAMIGELHRYKNFYCALHGKTCLLGSEEFRARLSKILPDPATWSFPSDVPSQGYQIIAEHLGVQCLIDSSKSISWIKAVTCPSSVIAFNRKIAQLSNWAAQWEEGLPDLNGFVQSLTKEPIYGQHIVVLVSKSPEAWFASIRRPGRGNAFFDVLPPSPHAAAGVWREEHSKMLAFLQQCQRKRWPTFQLRYEEVVQSPAQCLTPILQAAGLHWEAGQERFWEFEHHPIHSNAGAVASRQLRLDERWKRELTEGDIDIIRSYPGIVEVAKQLGYAFDA
jgi:hypothetical protein